MGACSLNKHTVRRETLNKNLVDSISMDYRIKQFSLQSSDEQRMAFSQLRTKDDDMYY